MYYVKCLIKSCYVMLCQHLPQSANFIPSLSRFLLPITSYIPVTQMNIIVNRHILAMFRINNLHFFLKQA